MQWFSQLPHKMAQNIWLTIKVGINHRTKMKQITLKHQNKSSVQFQPGKTHFCRKIFLHNLSYTRLHKAAFILTFLYVYPRKDHLNRGRMIQFWLVWVADGCVPWLRYPGNFPLLRHGLNEDPAGKNNFLRGRKHPVRRESSEDPHTLPLSLLIQSDFALG